MRWWTAGGGRNGGPHGKHSEGHNGRDTKVSYRAQNRYGTAPKVILLLLMADTMADTFSLGLLDESHQKDIYLFHFTTSPSIAAENAIPKASAQSLKVVELVRDASIFLGVLSFPPSIDLDKLPIDTTIITVHREVDGMISEADAMPTLGDTRLEQAGGTYPLASWPLDAILKRLLEDNRWGPLDKRPKTEALQVIFEKAHKKSARVCELSGETFSPVLMHLVPFELGSGVYTALLDAIQDQANRSWQDAHIAMMLNAAPHNPANPIIGNVAVIPPSTIREWANSTVRRPLAHRDNGSINTPYNIQVGSASLHAASDDHNALLLGTTVCHTNCGLLVQSVIAAQPPVWVAPESSLFEYTRGLPADPHLPVAPTSLVDTYAAIRRFFIQSIVDAATLFQRYGTDSLYERSVEILSALKAEIKHRKDLQREREQKEIKHRKATKRQREQTEAKKKKDRDVYEMDVVDEMAEEEVETDEGKPKKKKKTSGRMKESDSGGTLSTSSSGGIDQSGLSMGARRCVADRARRHHFSNLSISLLIQSSRRRGRTKKNSPSMDVEMTLGATTLERLLMTADDLEYDEEDGWMPLSSKELLQQLFNVLDPGIEEVERFGKINA
ncbi:hypothetical protein C8J57DRAFT_1468263, partial [Mycena rebaudengoi]